MPTNISLRKTEAREQLRKLAPLHLNRPVFFVPGWTDQGCLCWTEPYVEGGGDRRAGWEYTIQDWVESVVEPEDRVQVHFVKLVEEENNLTIERYSSGPRLGKIRSVPWDHDPSARYENFFQFAELLKQKIRQMGTADYDLIGHSMGGLDMIAATVLDRRIDRESEIQRFIISPPLEGVHTIVTVATPFRGSPLASFVERNHLDEILRLNWSDGIRNQAEAMFPRSPFIQSITDPSRQRRLLDRVKGSVHTFGSENDPATPNQARMIDGAINHPATGFELARHSMIMGITQDPRLALAVFRILVE